jgi:ParB-like chromosome segregation protein Spo0J
MKTETVKLGTLTPHPENVRQGDIGLIAESLKAHGQYRPIVAQTSTRHILAGNHTWKAAKALKWDTIEVTWIDCDNEEALRILLVDNRANDEATYNEPDLATILINLMKTEQELAGTGYTPEDLDNLLLSLELDPIKLEPEIPEPDNPQEKVFRCPDCGFEWTQTPQGHKPI